MDGDHDMEDDDEEVELNPADILNSQMQVIIWYILKDIWNMMFYDVLITINANQDGGNFEICLNPDFIYVTEPGPGEKWRNEKLRYE